MAKFRSKPTEIDAVQWFPGVEHPGIHRYALKTPIVCDDPFTLGEPTEWAYEIMTMHEQYVSLSPGDWIVAEPVPDRYYPIKPDVFAKKYEPILG